MDRSRHDLAVTAGRVVIATQPDPGEALTHRLVVDRLLLVHASTVDAFQAYERRAGFRSAGRVVAALDGGTLLVFAVGQWLDVGSEQAVQAETQPRGRAAGLLRFHAVHRSRHR